MDSAVETTFVSNRQDLRPHVLLGVDERHQNEGALRWATTEAARRHVALQLATICRIVPQPEVYVGREVDSRFTRESACVSERWDRIAPVFPTGS